MSTCLISSGALISGTASLRYFSSLAWSMGCRIAPAMAGKLLSQKTEITRMKRGEREVEEGGNWVKREKNSLTYVPR